MQDWEWEIADPERLDEYRALLDTPELSESERISLVEMLLECFEVLAHDGALDARWEQLDRYLTAHHALHASTLAYWSDGPFKIAEAVRRIVERRAP